MHLAREGHVHSITCEEILGEFAGKLRTKFGFALGDADLAAGEVQRFSTVVPITGTIRLVVSDPGDDKVLECAVLGSASHIVTDDRKHLLPIKVFRSIAIITAAEFAHVVNAD